MTDREKERAAYDQLCFYTLSHPDKTHFIHQHVVDAYTAQHADRKTKPITITFALVGLYLMIEKKYSGREVQRVHMQLAKRKKEFPEFTIPEKRGDTTAIDVIAAPPAEARDAVIMRWCESVWEAYKDERQKVIGYLGYIEE